MTEKINLLRPSAFAGRAELFYSDISGRTRSVLLSKAEDGQSAYFLDGASGIFSKLIADKPFKEGKSVYVAKWRSGSGDDFLDFRKKLIKKTQNLVDVGLKIDFSIEINLLIFQKHEESKAYLEELDYAPVTDFVALSFVDKILLECDSLGISVSCVYQKENGYLSFLLCGGALSLADSVLLFKVCAKRVSSEFNLGVTFTPLPFFDKKGEGLGFALTVEGEKRESFLEGLVLHAMELLPLTSPTVNSFARLGLEDRFRYLCHGSADTLYESVIDGDKLCVKFDFPDLLANPYILFCSLIEAGIMGVEKELALSDRIEELTPSACKSLVRIPSTLGEALEVSWSSGFLKRVLGESASRIYYGIKKEESESFNKTAGEGEHRGRYFHFF